MEDTRLMLEMSELTLRSLYGILDESGLLQFEGLLEDNPIAVEYYQELLLTHVGLESLEGISSLQENNTGPLETDFWEAMLEEEKNAPEIETEESPQELIQKVIYPPREKHRISKFNLFTPVMSAAAIFLLVVFAKFVPVKNQDFAPVNYQYHAVMTDSVNANWADGAEAVGIGEELSLDHGDFWLQSGYVKLLFGNGAEVIIESPSRFEVLSGNELNLIRGRMYSKVPERARGFTVLTPNSQVIDLGTEFGVEVQGGGRSSVHMVKGKASVLPENGLLTQQPIELTAGHAKAIDRDGISQDIRIDSDKFVSDISSQMAMIYRADKVIGVGIWDRQISENLAKDLLTDGRVIHAVNLGRQPVKPATVCGIAFNPIPRDGIVTGGLIREEKIEYADYNGSDQDLAWLLTSGRFLHDRKQKSIGIQIDGLSVGQEYRIQLIFGFPWGWTDVNCYGVNREHMYFANTIGDSKLGLATYRWKAKSTTETITLTSPSPKSGEVNYVGFFGYVVHELNGSDPRGL